MPEFVEDPAWSVCPICGAVVAAADFHATWHSPPALATTVDPTPAP